MGGLGEGKESEFYYEGDRVSHTHLLQETLEHFFAAVALCKCWLSIAGEVEVELRL